MKFCVCNLIDVIHVFETYNMMTAGLLIFKSQYEYEKLNALFYSFGEGDSTGL